MEILGDNGDKNIEAQHTTEQPHCTYRDLNDETKATEFYKQYSLEDLGEDSPGAEELLGQPICNRPSCLLNFRILISYLSVPGMQQAIEDFDWAVPPDCEWRNTTGIRSNRKDSGAS